MAAGCLAKRLLRWYQWREAVFIKSLTPSWPRFVWCATIRMLHPA